MEALRVAVTIWHILMTMLICLTCRTMKWPKDKASITGFGVMAVMYVLALILIWR